ncbi:type II toxin-antitoxin system YafQ family toxin [Campylobacter upsaliensis]|uniref:type II toxin-antitoxin system YafQ family toxin n=1 Tax=Campylobacter upsaliensis TaxID=28080 RepID=UPI001275A753|nr:type II toxin-antitoxin system YafQ family toxin [Campylobacter upsaliensis]EAH7598100.1 type II toxin-antitoxin system YafQ family toxin [Campylobacter upsaliensis]EAI3918250.1 type II toxin-antitoxin system YafQ family toxin [Campylobacter upsaliensis]EAI8565360.1 type II toxin-antitoxin system YafQ family toxin [Campylobacter upsaliensis]EAJ2428059.1 type II toxin-antitoxin system YafQ family toxin [Campylobacter upsaliensis]EAJ7019349.1 type II toxin-antitoxin system YafQ family toxin [
MQNKYSVVFSKKFKKDFKKLSKDDKEICRKIVDKLADDEPLEPKYKDHALKGNYIGFRECHIKPDLLLIYRKNNDILELYLANLGNHNNVF